MGLDTERTGPRQHTKIAEYEIDGVDLRCFSLAALRNSVTVLFQQPVHYNATVAQNVAWGDVVAPPDPRAVKAALELAGAVEIVERLPHGYDQLLGRWFENGTELSAGEWQRIALARAFRSEERRVGEEWRLRRVPICQ